MNRLADEPSPYLRQHQENPVDWWPWCDEAFAEAERRDVPIFLSIGYATCHWCHVMAHESFEDDEVAALLNEDFIAIKVDREERPDVDEVYMAVCQAMNGSGGWPLTVVMAPDKRPFFAGTYFPKQSRHGRIGMTDLLPRIMTMWKEERPRLLHSADHVLSFLARPPGAPGAPGGSDGADGADGADGPGGAGGDAAVELDPAWIDQAVAQTMARYDAEHGGFGTAPKFPSPHQFRFLLAHGEWDGRARDAVEISLKAIAQGGIHDHIGGGFHRYSTDAGWRLPHFEKMLYDQAALLDAFASAHAVRPHPDHEAAATGIVTYVIRDLCHAEGGFFCAEDADSEGEEGRFYVWTTEELARVLGGDESAFSAAYRIEQDGNFHDEATRQKTGANVLHRRGGAEAAAAHQSSLLRLYEARLQRIRPSLDDKILRDWNGLMIGALARAGTVFGRRSWIDAAARAAAFVDVRLRDSSGAAIHRWHDGRVDHHAFLDDHVFFADGALALFEATQDPDHLRMAVESTTRALEAHRAPNGAFTLPARGRTGADDLPVQKCEAFDGAIPSGNAVAASVLWRLGALTGDPRCSAASVSVLEAFAPELARRPGAYLAMLDAMSVVRDGGVQVVIVGRDDAADDMVAAAQSAARRRSGVVVVQLHGDGGERDQALLELAPWLAGHGLLDGRTTAYVCRDHACQAPLTDVAGLVDALRDSTAG